MGTGAYIMRLSVLKSVWKTIQILQQMVTKPKKLDANKESFNDNVPAQAQCDSRLTPAGRRCVAAPPETTCRGRPSCSVLLRNASDCSGLLRTAPYYSGLLLTAPDCSGLLLIVRAVADAPDCNPLLWTVLF